MKHVAHGMRGTRFYNIWANLKSRCLYKGNTEWERYGARGITVSKDWDMFLDFKRDMYASFLEHVEKFGERNTSIDRIDNSKGYSMENCKWATPKEQSRNTRRNRVLDMAGVSKSLVEWVESYNVPYSRVKARLDSGWDIERALTTQKRTKVS